eukprot:1617347-Amphidinium_carterae.1
MACKLLVIGLSQLYASTARTQVHRLPLLVAFGSRPDLLVSWASNRTHLEKNTLANPPPFLPTYQNGGSGPILQLYVPFYVSIVN